MFKGPLTENCGYLPDFNATSAVLGNFLEERKITILNILDFNHV